MGLGPSEQTTMSIYGAFNISGSGLQAQRVRMDAISANLANQRSPGFERIEVNFAPGDPVAGSPLGVHVSKIDRVPSFREEYQQVERGSEADLADGVHDGMGKLPDINYTTEMVNGIEALRAYEANIQALETTRSMIDSAIRVLA